MSDCELVFTAALRAELPVARLSQLGLSPQPLAAPQPHLPATDRGVRLVLTGMGPDASRRAAEWIRDRLTPRFVVNLGSAGALDPALPVGSWIAPDQVATPGGERRWLDTRLPFPWPPGLDRRRGGTLVTVAEPCYDPSPLTGAAVDMEAYPQAAVFAAAGIAFHVLKLVSDRAAADSRRQHAASLPRMRSELATVLSFLTAPGEPEIAVVIPVYDRADRIVATVESVVAQQLPAAEILVVDDASSDGSATVLDRFGEAVRVLRLPTRSGVSAARNRGVAATRSPWIAFLDSDDRWRPEKLRLQWQYLRRHPYYRILQSEELWIRNGERVNPRRHHRKPCGWIWHACLERCLVSPSSVLLARDLFDELGGFDERLPVAEDYDLWLRLARHHPVGLEPSPSLVKLGGHADQLSRRYPAMDRFRVRALAKALDAETDPRFRDPLVAMLRRKLAILLVGSRKRGLHRETRGYEAALRALPAPAVEEPTR